MNHEIMTIEEVANYLRVSERTVYDWAQKGQLPGGKLGTTWRFKRSDIESWVNEQLSKPGPRLGGGSSVTACSALESERVVLVDKGSKTEILTTLVDLLAESPLVKNRDKLL